MARNELKWGVIESAPFTPTGRDTLEAAFALKADAVAWLKQKHPKGRRGMHARWLVVKLAHFDNWPSSPTYNERVSRTEHDA